MIKSKYILTWLLPMMMTHRPVQTLHGHLALTRKSRFVHTSEKKDGKKTPCEAHRLGPCPACQTDDYMKRRVVKVVHGALKRLGITKSEPMLTYLGADSWKQVLELLEAKRLCWNLAFPDTQMTPTNIALDHIRPVRAFANESDGARILLCNHYTNLQPLLHEDNAWKGDFWSREDEDFWHKHIILNKDFDSVYYPLSAPSQPSIIFASRLGK